MVVPLPDNEAARLAALDKYEILDTAPAPEFDALVRLAAHICGTPIAAVTLIDEHRQWFKAITGLDVRETPRDAAFCAHTILQHGVMVVPDAQADPRFTDNPLVTGDPHIRFYAGVPLITEDGYALGSLCVIDQAPGHLIREQEEALRLLALQASSQLASARRIGQMQRLVAEKERLIAERKRADAALQAEREFQRALLESLQEGIVACDARGTLTLFNRATRDFHGLPEQPLPPDQWSEHFDLFHADGVTPMETRDIPLFRAFQGETVREAEMVIAPKTGSLRSLLASGQAIYGTDGEKLGAVIAMHDVTERRQAERENARLAAIVESAEEAILGATLDGTITAWNSGAERLYGYSAVEIIGRHASALAQSHEKELISEVITRLRRGEALPPREVVRDRPDGSAVHVSLSFSPIRDAAGQMIGISCISRDITDRKRAEADAAESSARLLESEARLRRLSDAAFEGICVGQDGVLVDVSTAFAELFGYDDPAQMVGVSPGALATPESRAPVLHKVAHFDEEPYEAILQRRDGTTFQAEIRARQTQLGGRPARITAIRNVTHQKDLEQDLRARAEALRRSEASLRAILESVPVILYAADADGTVTLSEGTGLAALGLAPGAAVGSSVFAFTGDTDLETPTRRALAGESASFDARVYGLCLHTELRPVQDAEGRPAGFIGVCFDVTERKNQEDLIRDHAVVLEYQKQELEKVNAELAALATTDGLTGLKNHRAFQERLAEEAGRAARYHAPLSLVLLDVDHFKQYNDTYGHPAGDAVLRTVARVLQAGARDTDIVARYGGEEFVLILPQTDLSGAAAFAERLRAAVAGHAWPVRPVTISLGVAQLRLEDEGGMEMITRADDALYRAKRAGRNHVTC